MPTVMALEASERDLDAVSVRWRDCTTAMSQPIRSLLLDQPSPLHGTGHSRALMRRSDANTQRPPPPVGFLPDAKAGSVDYSLGTPP